MNQLTAPSGDQPGVQAAYMTQKVHGRERACVLKYSASFLSEQVHSPSTSLATTTQALRRLSVELARPDCRLTEPQIRTKLTRRLASAPFLDLVTRHTLVHADGRWRLQFEVDTAAFHRLLTERLGRTVLMTNRLEWSAEQVVAAYGGQQHVEQVFRGLEDGDWLGWGPMYHWTDSKIRVHAFYGMLRISLWHDVHLHARRVCPQITIDQLKTELADIYDFVLLYPPRTATVQSKQTLTQGLLAQALGLDAFAPRRVGKTRRRASPPGAGSPPSLRTHAGRTSVVAVAPAMAPGETTRRLRRERGGAS
jgi:hypothetical protein